MSDIPSTNHTLHFINYRDCFFFPIGNFSINIFRIVETKTIINTFSKVKNLLDYEQQR